MLLVGNSSTVCQIDGRWRYPVPECLGIWHKSIKILNQKHLNCTLNPPLKTQIAPCVIPTIGQGTVIPMEKELDPNVTTPMTPTLPPSSNKVIHGTTLEVVCEHHYEFPAMSSTPPTCINGTWSQMPRCSPARCKTLPKPPKFAMILAPKTEHGMKARVKCKDGWKLLAPDGKDVSDENEYTLTCQFGNWTGQMPHCQELFCAFPGYVAHGKILLIGNMGLYDYRPYVKKIMNNKQIMYDCDKGYILSEKGPVGATCVGGLWRPRELPECLPALHPRLRWNRRRKRQALNTGLASYQPPMQFYRKFKRNMNDMLRNERIANEETELEQVLRRQMLLSNHIRQRRNQQRPSRPPIDFTRFMQSNNNADVNNFYGAIDRAHILSDSHDDDSHKMHSQTIAQYAQNKQQANKSIEYEGLIRTKRDDDDSDSKRPKSKEPCEVISFLSDSIYTQVGMRIDEFHYKFVSQ